MKKTWIAALMALTTQNLPAQDTNPRREVLIETTMGNIKVELYEGLNVVKEIDWMPTDDNARPIEDVRIIKMTVL